MTLVTDATFSLSSKSMPSSITWSAQRMRLARLWYTRLWQEDSAELLRERGNNEERTRGYAIFIYLLLVKYLGAICGEIEGNA